MKELDEDRELARQLKQPSAAIAATVAQAKLAGLIVDRKEVGQPGEFENMKAEELAEVLARNAAALGLKVSVKSHSSSKDRLAHGLERRLGQWLRALNPSGIGRLTCGATGRVTCHVRLHARDGRDQGQNLVVGESPAGHRGQIVKMLTSMETLCPTKEGTQHQRVA